MLPCNEVEVRKELEQKAGDTVAATDKTTSTTSDRFVHWLTNEPDFDKYAKYENDENTP